MITDLDEISALDLPEYDVCIVGSGPAGTTVANELLDPNLRICVLESGKLKPTRHGDRLREVRSDGIMIRDSSRERVLGGASTTWSGLSSPLDPIDMKPRGWLKQPGGWPIDREEFLSFYEEAAERYQFPPLHLFGPDGIGAIREDGDLAPAWVEVEEKLFLQAGEPQNFGREFRYIFDQGVDLYLDATVLRLEGDEEAGRVRSAVVRSGDGRERRLRARVFVVGAGGLENPRILLNSTGVFERGLGNEHDQVGRHLMNHPKNYHGIIRLERPVAELPYYFGCLYRGYAVYAGLRLKERIQEERKFLNSYVRFLPLFPWSDNAGVEALVLFARRSKVLLKIFRDRSKGKVVSLRDYSETGDDSELQNERKSALEWVGILFAIAINLPRVAQYLRSRLIEKAKPQIRKIRLQNFMEMEPDPENRVILGEERDVYGQPVPLVRHQCTELDRASLVALHETLADEISRAGLGKLTTELGQVEPWPIDQDASHHLGTTRMGLDPASSVVDPNLKIHSVENVYMVGGSVFPTSGCANPTFTIVALSIRLARHLRRTILGRGAIESRT